MNNTHSTALRFKGLKALPKLDNSEKIRKHFFTTLLQLVNNNTPTPTDINGNSMKEYPFNEKENDTVIWLRLYGKGIHKGFSDLDWHETAILFVQRFVDAEEIVIKDDEFYEYEDNVKNRRIIEVFAKINLE